MTPKARSPGSTRSYVLAIGLLLAAVLLQWAVRPAVGTNVPFVFFFPALGIAAMWCGWRPALLVLLGGLVHAFFWMAPGGAANVWFGNSVALIGYLAAGSLLVALGAKLSRLRWRAEQAEADLGEQVQDLRLLHELGGRLTLIPQLPDQLGEILRTLCNLYRTEKGLVSLRGPDGALQVASSVGFSEAGLRLLDRLPAGSGAGGMAFQSRRTVIVQDVQADPRVACLLPVVALEGFRAVHSRPLLNAEGEIFGVLSVHLAQPRPPTDREDRLGDLCARMACAVAERDVARREARALHRRVQVALETSAVPFGLLKPIRGADGRVADFRWEYFNAAAARAMKREPQELAGRSASEVLPALWRDPELFARYVQVLESAEPVQFEVTLEDGVQGCFNMVASPLDDGLAVWFADVSESRRQEQLLREADRRKDEFLATLAHELRNPLAPIRQAALVARAPTAGEEQKRRSLEVIERQVANMALLLDDLLDVSRITRGKLELRREPSDLRQVLEAAVEAARPALDSRRQRLHIDAPPAPLWSDVDPMRIAQVLSNLLTNASKYTPPEGEVWLSARNEDGVARIEVRDNGIGIAPAALEQIFKMFTQIRGPQAAGSTGLGIGLSLSRGLVELHGGSLAADSAGEGLGSRFTVTLPLGAAAVATVLPAVLPVRLKRARRILVADDNRDAADSLGEILRMEGHDVVLAYDGEMALRQYESFQPDVALLDIGMPRLTGNQVAEAIRARPEGGGTMLVAITGWGQQRDRSAAHEAGFDHHFTKPVDPVSVIGLLEAADAPAVAELQAEGEPS